MIEKSAIEKFLGKKRLKTKIDLSSFLSLRVATKAVFYFEAQSVADWIKVKKASLSLNLPLLIIGGGSNIVITNPIDNYLVVKNSYIKKEIIKEDNEDIEILVSSGYPVSKLVNETIRAGYEGLEYQLGLPGTVGGAIYMNSKWTKPISYFGDNLQYANLIDSRGKIKKVSNDYFKFGYDYSILQKTKEILLEAVFKFKKIEANILFQRSNKALKYRKKTQPFGKQTSGCFFKNISEKEKKRIKSPTRSAGYLIEKSGLKGFKLGDFEVSEKHANFIINKAKGKPKDLLRLINMIKKTVKERFNVDLEEEVVVI